MRGEAVPRGVVAGAVEAGVAGEATRRLSRPVDKVCRPIKVEVRCGDGVAAAAGVAERDRSVTDRLLGGGRGWDGHGAWHQECMKTL
jgi:hypothetical protein